MKIPLLLMLTLACGLPIAATHAQEPIIAETTGKKAVPPKPRPKPKPVYPKPKLLWKTFLRRVDGSPASVGTVTYVAAGSYLQQLDNGGRTLWSTETGPVQSSPALDDTRVYVGSDKGILYAMNRKTGQGVWKFPASNTIQTQPAVGAGRVYAESSDNNVYALDAVSGGLKWKFTRPDGSLGYSSPVFASDAVFVGGETILYRLNAETGKEDWHAFVGGKSLSTPAVGGDSVFVGGDSVGLVAFALADGKPLWTFKGKATSDWFGAPLFAAGTVYVSTYSRYVYAVDAGTGKQKWSYRLLGNALALPALDTKRNVLYVTSATFRDNPTLTALDAKTGAKLWDYKMGYISGAPLISEDRLYVGSTNGYFYAFALGE